MTVQVILGTQSNVWAALALPNPPAGAVPFVFTDNTTIACAALDFNFDAAEARLTITNGIEQTYADISSVPGIAGVINNSCGRFAVAAASAVFTLSNSLAEVGDIVLTQQETFDSTWITATAVVTLAGVITVSSSAPATGNTNITFQLMKVR